MTEKVEQEKVVKETKQDEQEKVEAPIGSVNATGSHPAIEVKHDLLAEQPNLGQVYTNSDGVEYRLVPVGSTIVQAAMEKIPDPVMRTYTNPNTGKEEANPGHPDYISELKEVEEKRQGAAVDAMMMFGVEIVGELPKEIKWLKQMLFLNLISDADFQKAKEDEFSFEFYYKRYKMSNADVMNKISALSGVSQEAIAKAKDSFQRN